MRTFIFISQSIGSGISRTASILDRYAVRVAQDTWQTPLTQEGLKTLYELLKDSATRFMHVHCFDVVKGTRNLIWSVGAPAAIWHNGAIPVHTHRHVKKNMYTDTQKLALMTAYLSGIAHDFGKANNYFQKKLRDALLSSKPLADPIRHEWFSHALVFYFMQKYQKDIAQKDIAQKDIECLNWSFSKTWREMEKYFSAEDAKEERPFEHLRSKHKLFFTSSITSITKNALDGISDAPQSLYFKDFDELVLFLIATHHRLPDYLENSSNKNCEFRNKIITTDTYFNKTDKLYTTSLYPATNGLKEIKNNKSSESIENLCKVIDSHMKVVWEEFKKIYVCCMEKYGSLCKDLSNNEKQHLLFSLAQIVRPVLILADHEVSKQFVAESKMENNETKSSNICTKLKLAKNDKAKAKIKENIIVNSNSPLQKVSSSHQHNSNNSKNNEVNNKLNKDLLLSQTEVSSVAPNGCSKQETSKSIDLSKENFNFYANTGLVYDNNGVEKIKAQTPYKKERCLNQELGWHLGNVAHQARAYLKNVFDTQNELAGLGKSSINNILRMAPANSRFRWQDDCSNFIAQINKYFASKSSDQKCCALVFNHAGTGQGKTRMNAKLLAKLNPEGRPFRFHCALNLRSLTLQTAQAYEQEIQISADQMCSIIGDKSAQEMFFKLQATGIKDKNNQVKDGNVLDEDDNVPDEELLIISNSDGCSVPSWMRGALKNNSELLKITSHPVVVSTVDYLTAAQDFRKQGTYAQAFLRFIHSDLILDEIDAYEPSSLVSILRLVMLSAFFGNNTIVSSATTSKIYIQAISVAFKKGILMRQSLFGKTSAVIYFCSHQSDPKQEHNGTISANLLEFDFSKLSAESSGISTVKLLPVNLDTLELNSSESIDEIFLNYMTYLLSIKDNVVYKRAKICPIISPPSQQISDSSIVSTESTGTDSKNGPDFNGSNNIKNIVYELNQKENAYFETVYNSILPLHNQNSYCYKINDFEQQYNKNKSEMVCGNEREQYSFEKKEIVKDVQISFGLVRFSRIRTVVAFSRFLAQQMNGQIKTFDASESPIPILVACYHSQMTLACRHYLEQQLDVLLKRSSFDPRNKELFPDSFHLDVLKRLEEYPNSKQIICIVVASPVEEVGRDHDFDWAIIEPSSAQSIVQTSGRVNRHRMKPLDEGQYNIGLLDHSFEAFSTFGNFTINSKKLKTGFSRPGLDTVDEYGKSFFIKTIDTQSEKNPRVKNKVDGFCNANKNVMQNEQNISFFKISQTMLWNTTKTLNDERFLNIDAGILYQRSEASGGHHKSEHLFPALDQESQREQLKEALQIIDGVQVVDGKSGVTNENKTQYGKFWWSSPFYSCFSLRATEKNAEYRVEHQDITTTEMQKKHQQKNLFTLSSFNNLGNPKITYSATSHIELDSIIPNAAWLLLKSEQLKLLESELSSSTYQDVFSMKLPFYENDSPHSEIWTWNLWYGASKKSKS